MKKICILYSKSDETNLLERFIDELKIPVAVERPPMGKNLYERASKDKKNIYIMGKSFLHGVGIKTQKDFMRIFRMDNFERLYFIEKPPFRFKQGKNDKVNKANCGVLLSHMSTFVNNYNLRRFIATEFNKRTMKIEVDAFRQHWIDYNEPKEIKHLKGKKVIYFPLQLPQDASVKHMGFDYPMNEMINTLYYIFARMYDNFVLVVREHPYNRRNYVYKPNFSDDRVMLNVDYNHADLIHMADVVASFNSSSLAEAILNNKKVLYFANLPVIDFGAIGFRIPSWNYYNASFINNVTYLIRDYLNSDNNEYFYLKYIYYIIRELSFFINFTPKKVIKEFLYDKFDL